MITLGILTRIVSNSYLNVFQKILTQKGASSSCVNFYTYLGLTVLGLVFIRIFNMEFTTLLIFNTLIMGLLGALGNYFIIKSLSLGELSSIAPINSYKPIVALIIAFIYLGELPSGQDFIGILLIISGTYFLIKKSTFKEANKKAIFYRLLALVFSGCEAVFIKKIITLTNITESFFLWAVSGMIFAFLFTLKNKDFAKFPPLKEQFLLIICVGIMQYSTNYVFANMTVSSALALFQLSAILSVLLGANIFQEKCILQKIFSSTIMILGATIIIL